jgi:hypothetical protein
MILRHLRCGQLPSATPRQKKGAEIDEAIQPDTR